MSSYTKKQYRESYAYLRWTATMGLTVGYQELSNEANLELDMQLTTHRNIIGELLGDISIAEHAASRPLLSAVVIGVKTGRVGDGFWKMTAYLNLLATGAPDAKKLAFETSERQRVFSHWAV